MISKHSGALIADTDSLIQQCLEDHDAYQETKAHRKFLVLGRKGSGKTAIFRKYLSTRGYDIFTFGHIFNDYPWHFHDKQATIGVPEEQRYVHCWRYLILITIAKILLNQDQSQPWSEETLEGIRKIERFDEAFGNFKSVSNYTSQGNKKGDFVQYHYLYDVLKEKDYAADEISYKSAPERRKIPRFIFLLRQKETLDYVAAIVCMCFWKKY